MVEPASIVVLNWNGAELLYANMPALMEAVSASGGHHEVIVVDNGSTDNSLLYLKQAHPTVKVVPLPSNLGLVRGYNIGSAVASHNVTVHLNNSVRVNRDFFNFLLPHFANPDVFAVHPKLVASDGTIEAELSFATFDDHILFPRQPHSYVPDTPYYLAPCYSMYAPGGCWAYNRWKYWLLGGNDEMYSPFHWEESDISYRAWKRGWKVLYEPHSVGWHKVHATIGRMNQVSSMETYFRNQILFNWVNLTDPDLLDAHFASLPAFVHKDPLHYNAYHDALRFVPNVISRRLREAPNRKRTDREVVDMLSDNGTGVPNGTFVIHEGVVYLIERGRKRHVPDESVLFAHTRPGNVLPVSSNVLDRFPGGEPLGWPEGTAVLDEKGTVYLIQDQKRRPVDSPQTAQLLGLVPDYAHPAHPANLKETPAGKQLNVGLHGLKPADAGFFTGLRRLLGEMDLSS